MKVNSTLKKSLIIVFVLFHSITIGIWSIWGQRLNTSTNHTQNIIASYIALTGTERYWDLFASESYDEHQSLIVCDEVMFPNSSQEVICIGNILYQSYDGDLNRIFQKFSGNRNRSYRFTEQLIALNDETAYEQFLQYWRKQSLYSTKNHYLYLIAQFKLVKEFNSKQTNTLLWVIKHS